MAKFTLRDIPNLPISRMPKAKSMSLLSPIQKLDPLNPNQNIVQGALKACFRHRFWHGWTLTTKARKALAIWHWITGPGLGSGHNGWTVVTTAGKWTGIIIAYCSSPDLPLHIVRKKCRRTHQPRKFSGCAPILLNYNLDQKSKTDLWYMSVKIQDVLQKPSETTAIKILYSKLTPWRLYKQPPTKKWPSIENDKNKTDENPSRNFMSTYYLVYFLTKSLPVPYLNFQ